MSQITDLINTIKSEMKYRGLRYQDIADALGVSESSARRLFSQRHLTLERVEAVCTLMGMQISDLIYSMESTKKRLTQLTVEQEQELASEPVLLLIAYLAVNGWTYNDIKAHYRISDPDLIKHLIRLEKIGMLELMPQNRIKLRVTEGFSWREDGPVLSLFLASLEKDFFASRFNRPNEILLLMTGSITPSSVGILKEKLTEVKRLFSQIIRQERGLAVKERTHIGIVAAMRPLRFHQYDPIRSAENTQPSV